jgi:hypothetical protein
MASTDARPIPRKNAAYRVTFMILDADGDLVTGLDSEVSIDAGTFTDCTNEATEIATASGMYYLDLTSAEMNGDTIAIIVKTSSSGAKTTPIVLYPEEAGDIRVDVTMLSGDATAADNAESFFDGTGYAGTNNVIPLVTTTTTATTATNVTTVNGLAANVITATSINADAITAAKIADGAIDAATFAAGAINAAAIATDAITAAKIAADAIGASELAADAVTEIQSGLATSASIVTLQADTDDIQTRLPAALVSGRMDSSVGAMAANVITATAINADAITDAKVASDVTIASVTGAVGSVTAGVTVTTNNDKTGYGLSAAAVQAIWDALTSALTTVGSIGKRISDNLDAAITSRMATFTYTTPPTAVAIRTEMDSNSTKLANLDATISSRATPAQVNTEADTALADVGLTTTVTGRIDAAISTRLATAGYTAPPTAAANADAIWDETLSGHLTTGSTGEALNGAGAAGDPWTTTLPGAYGAGSAGKIIGDNINATVSSRATQVSVDDIPTNAELATSQAAADDATLAAIAGISIPTVSDILAGVIEGSITLKGALRLAISVLTGKASGGGTTTIVFRDTADTKARITATVDSNGNRTTVTRDITD